MPEAQQTSTERAAALPDAVPAAAGAAPPPLRIAAPGSPAGWVELVAGLPPDDRAGQINSLQRTAGNLAVTRLLRAAAPVAPAAPAESAAVKEIKEHMRQGSWDVDTLAAKLTDADMRALDAGVRMQLIANVAGGAVVAAEDEMTIVRLRSTAPAAEAPAMLAHLESNHKLLARLEQAIDGEEYAAYEAQLRALFFAAKDPKTAKKEMESAEELPWADPTPLKVFTNPRFWYEDAKFTEQGRISLVWYSKGEIGPMTTERHTKTLDPLEMVKVRFYIPDPELGAKVKGITYMPAANFLAMVHKQHHRGEKTGLDLAFLVGGLGALGGATRLARVLAGLDVAMGAAGLIINSYRDDIAESENGQEFLDVWDTVQTLYAIYGLVRLALQVAEVFGKLKGVFVRWKGTGARSVLPATGAQVDQDVQKVLDEAEKEAAKARPSAAGRAPPAP